jgi:hypothetical protein
MLASATIWIAAYPIRETMMEVNYSPEVRQQVDTLALLEAASERLVRIAPKSAQLAKAEWTQFLDHRRHPQYRLTIRDGEEEAATEFTLEQLRNSLHMDYRVAALWGDLLQVRGDRVHDQMLSLVDELLAASGT